MRIAKVIGNVTLSRNHPSVDAVQWKVVSPLVLSDLKQPSPLEPTAEEIIAIDELSVGIGEWVAFSEGVEAAMPFYPNEKPIDAYVAAIIDHIDVVAC